ncbi:hypothetical protein C8D87_109195 [Lentzea atacamensis]|uniref:Uncharacterized protein n=1 Tax=Lentzea atacamensis TaxID=531938 RepID=A0ABX9E104_9PSEU|nr:hypothetical protein C8D87_109195 [Lentzea atacamensis]
MPCQPVLRSTCGIRSTAGSANQAAARSCFSERTARGSWPVTTSRTRQCRKPYSISPVSLLRPLAAQEVPLFQQFQRLGDVTGISLTGSGHRAGGHEITHHSGVPEDCLHRQWQ